MARSRLFSWRILRLHLALIVCVTAFVWLADWQFHRALSGNELSWAYAFEWPLFTIYAFFLWRRLVLDELGIGATPSPRHRRFLPNRNLERAARRELARAAQNAAEDQERERYNAYLTALHDEGPDEHHEEPRSDGAV